MGGAVAAPPRCEGLAAATPRARGRHLAGARDRAAAPGRVAAGGEALALGLLGALARAAIHRLLHLETSPEELVSPPDTYLFIIAYS